MVGILLSMARTLSLSLSPNGSRPYHISLPDDRLKKINENYNQNWKIKPRFGFSERHIFSASRCNIPATKNTPRQREDEGERGFPSRQEREAGKRVPLSVQRGRRGGLGEGRRSRRRHTCPRIRKQRACGKDVQQS